MEDLNLPFFKKSLSEPRPLSMDDYLKFVEFNLKYTVDIKAARKWRKGLAVNVPFVLGVR